MSTREILKQLGAEQGDEALVQAGIEVLRDRFRKLLRDSGITEAVGANVELTNGEKFTILSDANPRMNTPASEIQNIELVQSAKAGSWANLLAE